MNVPDMPFLKKIDAVVLVFMLSTLMFGVSAQEKVENRGILQQMRDLFSGSSLLERDLVGGWEYRRTACMFETENLLKKAGGAVVASQVEKHSTNIAPGSESGRQVRIYFQGRQYLYCKTWFVEVLGKVQGG